MEVYVCVPAGREMSATQLATLPPTCIGWLMAGAWGETVARTTGVDIWIPEARGLRVCGNARHLKNVVGARAMFPIANGSVNAYLWSAAGSFHPPETSRLAECWSAIGSIQRKKH